MRVLAWLAVCTLVACSKPSEPAGPGAAGAPDASATAAAATPVPAPAAAPVGAGLDMADAGLGAADAGMTADAGTAPGAGAKKAGTGATAASKFTPTKVPEGAAAICTTIASRYDAIRKAAPLTCKVDADCSCHLVLTQDRVLAVSDKVSAAKLQSMSMAYRKARCPSTPATASQTCEPKCQAGRCR